MRSSIVPRSVRPLSIVLLCLTVSGGSEVRAEPLPGRRTDPNGDPLPAGALARLGTERLRHGDRIDHAVFSADGKLVASANTITDLTIRVWETATGKSLLRLRVPPREGPRAIALSPDGKTLAAITRQDAREPIARLHLWDVASGKVLRSAVLGPFAPLTGSELRFSPDGQTLAAGLARVVLVDARTGKQRAVLSVGEGGTAALAFAPDSRTLAVAGHDGTVRFVDVATGKERGTFEKLGSSALAFAPGGRTLAVGVRTGNAVRLWQLDVPADADKPVGRKDGPVLEALFDPACCLAFSRDGTKLAVGTWHGHCYTWDVGRGKRPHWSHLPGQPTDLLFTDKGEPLAVLIDQSREALRLLDLAAGKERLAVPGHLAAVTALAFFPDGKTLASAGDGLLLWDAEGKLRGRLHNAAGRLASQLSFSPDGKTLAVVEEAVLWWDLGAGKAVKTWNQTASRHKALAIDPGHKRLAVHLLVSVPAGPMGRGVPDTRYVPKLWDAETGKQGERLPHAEDAALRGMTFSPDGSVLAGYGQGLSCWDAETGAVLHETSSGPAFQSLALAPDGKTMAVTRGADVRLLEVATGAEVRRWQIEAGELIPGYPRGCPLTFGANGRLVVAGTQRGNLYLWDAVTGESLGQRTGHSHGVSAFALSPDGKLLASGSADTTILLWDLAEVEARLAKAALPYDRERLAGWWDHLAGKDAARAHRAVWSLAAGKDEAVKELAERIRPVPEVDRKQVARLIADLDHKAFPTREEAEAELKQMGELAAPLLREELTKSPTLEARRRLEELLRTPVPWTAERLRGERATRVLELVGTAEARKLLRELAGGAAGARLTRGAKVALRRLDGR